MTDDIDLLLLRLWCALAPIMPGELIDRRILRQARLALCGERR